MLALVVLLCAVVALASTLLARAHDAGVKAFYENLFRRAEQPGSTRLLARMGEVNITEQNFSFTALNGESTAPLSTLPLDARRLILQRLLLRRLTILRGLQEGVFQTPDAARYLLPRVESALEEYYCYVRGNLRGLELEEAALLSSQDLPHRLSAELAPLKRQRPSPEQLRQEVRSLFAKRRAARLNQARQSLARELIEKDPPSIEPDHEPVHESVQWRSNETP